MESFFGIRRPYTVVNRQNHGETMMKVNFEPLTLNVERHSAGHVFFYCKIEMRVWLYLNHGFARHDHVHCIATTTRVSY